METEILVVHFAKSPFFSFGGPSFGDAQSWETKFQLCAVSRRWANLELLWRDKPSISNHVKNKPATTGVRKEEVSVPPISTIIGHRQFLRFSLRGTSRGLELPASRTRCAQFLWARLKAEWSLPGVVPSETKDGIALAVFRYDLRVLSGLSFPGSTSLTACICHESLIVVDTLVSHWLRTYPSFAAAFTRLHTAVNHAIRIALYESNYTSTLEPSLGDSSTYQHNLVLREDELVNGARVNLTPFRMWLFPVLQSLNSS